MSALLLMLAALCNAAGAAEQQDSGALIAHFDIPAGDAERTLQQFLDQILAQAGNFQAFYSTDEVRGAVTHAVRGDLDPRDALKAMLEGTPLETDWSDDHLFVSIHRAPELGTPSPATVSSFGTPNAARGRPDVPLQAFANEQELQEVVVTGTLIHGVLDIMSPLTRVSRRELNRSSYASVQDALDMLPMNFGGGPSEDVGTTGNFTRGTAANLRGLGAGATLVLVNGHRQPYSGTEGDFVDLSSIPWSAVARIEVLPDGASALYGSDAIAGVVNIIMRDDFDGAEMQGRYGVADGGAGEKLFSQLFGTDWNNGRGLISYQYSERGALPAAARAYAANMDKTPLGGSDHRSFRSSPGNILDPATLLPIFGIPNDQDGKNLDVADLKREVNLQNLYDTYELLSERRAHSLFLSGSQQVGAHLELFGDARYVRRELSQTLFGYEQPIIVPATNPFFVNPFPDTPYVAIGYNFLNDLGPMHLRSTDESFSGSLGTHLKLGDSWQLTLSESYGRERTRFSIDNQADIGALAAALADPDPLTAFNPFGDGSDNSSAILDRIRASQTGDVVSDISTATLVADGPIGNIFLGRIKMAAGLEHRKESLHRRLFSNDIFARTIDSAFAEVAVPIIGDTEDPYSVPRLELSLAGRFESYSDFGATANPKIGLRWAPSNSVKLRASWGTAFRAPKLVDLYNSSQNLAALVSLRDPASSSGSSVVLAYFANNPRLKEERASTWTAGIDFAPASVRGLTASLTYYEINYEGRIDQPASASQVDILMNEDQWASAIKRNPTKDEIAAICGSAIFRGPVDQCNSASIAAIVDFSPRNMAATRVRGLDFKLDQVFDSQYGKFAVRLNGAYTFDFDQAASDTAPLIDLVNTAGNPLTLRLRATTEWYQRDWDQPGFGISFTVEHSPRYIDGVVVDRNVGASTIADLHLSYRTARRSGLLENCELDLNASNLLDKPPPFPDREAGYDVANAQPYGRVVSINVQKRW